MKQKERNEEKQNAALKAWKRHYKYRMNKVHKNNIFEIIDYAMHGMTYAAGFEDGIAYQKRRQKDD